MPTRGAGTARLPPDLEPALDALRNRHPELPLDVRWHDSLPSTMDVVAAAGDAGAPPGLIVGADAQSAGRGRRGRTWLSPPGAGLYFSLLVRPTRHVQLLTIAAGVAVRGGIGRATGVQADLKWPNDLLVRGRKLAGLLAEGARVGTADVAVTLGVGINLRRVAIPPEIAARATCIEAAIGRPVDRGHVFASVVDELLTVLAAIERDEADGILRAWRAGSPSAVGTRVEWLHEARVRRGVTAGIDDAGALLVDTACGRERILAGELTWYLPDVPAR